MAYRQEGEAIGLAKWLGKEGGMLGKEKE